MSSWLVLAQMVRIDVLQRTRSYSFFVTCALLVLIALEYLPPHFASYATVAMWHSDGVYRGIYSSAWVGTVMACLCTVLLSLVCFFQVKDALARDCDTRIGRIIAASSMSRWHYTCGKTLSSFCYLVVMVGVIMLAAAGVQLIRGEDRVLDAGALVLPFLVITLPTMALVAGLAILFASAPGLRGRFGNLLYISLWLAAIVICMLWIGERSHHLEDRSWFDPYGFIALSNSLGESCRALHPGLGDGLPRVIIFVDQPIRTFAWEGISLTRTMLLSKLQMLGLAAGLAVIAGFFFSRFDPARVVRSPQPTDLPEQEDKERDFSLAPVVSTRRLTLLVAASPTWLGQLGMTLFAELRMIHKELQLWWYLVAASLVATTLLASPYVVFRFLLPAVWLWPLLVWSPLGNRERRHLTHRMIFSASRPLQRQLLATWLAGFLVAVLSAGGIMTRLVLNGSWTDLFALAMAAVFIPSLAICCGIWSGGKRLFEVVYILLWYAGPINGIVALDFMGVSEGITPGHSLMVLLVSLILSALAVTGRYRRLRDT